MSDPNPPPSALAPIISPLSEADPNSINLFISERVDAIFNKQAKHITDDDLKVMVEYYRKERQRYLEQSQAKANLPPKPRKAPASSVADAIASSLDLI